jgi:hypothetical protein
MPGRTAKIHVSTRELPSLEKEDSFSFGSFDEENDTKHDALKKNKGNSFRLNIRKVMKNAESLGNAVGLDRIRSVPLTKKELNNMESGNVPSEMTKVITTTNDGALDRRAAMSGKDPLYANSWRAINASAKSLNSQRSIKSRLSDPNALQSESSRDDENESGQGYINSFVSALGFGSSRDTSQRFNQLEMKASVLSSQTQSVEVRLSETEVKKLFDTCAKAIADEEWHVVVNSIIYCKHVVGLQTEDYERKNLFHLVASQHILPEKLLDLMMEADPLAHKQPDEHGCVPLHYAASIGRNEEIVKYLLKVWPFGASARSVDGDLPLHVAVWCGEG